MPPTTALPVRAVDRLTTAGQSVYAWHDQQLLSWLDPKGRWTHTSRILSSLAMAALVAGMTWESFSHSLWGGAATTAAFLGSAWATRSRRISWWAFAAAALFIDMRPEHTSTALFFGTVGVVLLLCLMSPDQPRTVVFGVLAATLALAHLGFGPSFPGRDWACLVVAAALSVVALWLRCDKTIPVPLGRLTRAHLTATPPSPPTGLPWLVALRPKNQRRLRHVPPEISRKKAGGYGERKTALLLLGLTAGKGYRIVHDVDVPGAREANVDHVVLGRTGVFVLDSKQYGRRVDPGVIRWDHDTSTPTHMSGSGIRSLAQPLATLAWEAEAVSRTVGAPTRAVMVVHGAHVEQPLSIHYPTGVTIDVIGASHLLDRIEGCPKTLTRAELAHTRWAVRKLRTAVGKTSPRVVGPLGVAHRPRPVPWQPRDVTVAVPTDWSAAPRAGRRLPPAPAEPTWRPTAEDTVTDLGNNLAAYGVEPPTDYDDPRWPTPSDDDHEEPTPDLTAEEVIAAEMAALDASVPVGDGVRVTLDDLWSQMQQSDPLPADEVPADMRTIGPGSTVDMVEFSDDPAGFGLRRTEHVAVSGLCRGRNGPYVWLTSAEQWQIHRETGLPVNIATVPADKVIATRKTT